MDRLQFSKVPGAILVVVTLGSFARQRVNLPPLRRFTPLPGRNPSFYPSVDWLPRLRADHSQVFRHSRGSPNHRDDAFNIGDDAGFAYRTLVLCLRARTEGTELHTLRGNLRH